MELDDLKERWRASEGIPSKEEIRKDLEKWITEIRSSGRGIRKMFILEIGVALLMYAIFFVVVWVVGEKIMPFMYKMIAIVTIGAIPPVWRLFKAQKWINAMNYGNDMRSNMVDFLAYYKKTLVIYKVSFYVVIVASIAFMFTERSFTEMPFKWKSITILYTVGVGLLINPYIRFLYGGRTSSIEAFLRE